MINISRKSVAYNYLYEEIIEGKLAPNTTITETDIANKLGISRTPVREALKELELDGLIVGATGRSSIVSDITPDDVEEIFSIRIALELLALEKSINRISDGEIDRLIEIFKNEKKDFSWERNHQYDKELHGLLIKRSGNKRLKIFLNNLNAQIERFRRIAAKSKGRANKSIDEHIDILLSIKTRDIEKSKESLKKHLLSVKNSVIDIAVVEALTSLVKERSFEEK